MGDATVAAAARALKSGGGRHKWKAETAGQVRCGEGAGRMVGLVGNGERDAGYFRCHVFCCVNERAEGNSRGCCKRKGGLDLRNYMKTQARRLGLEGVRINSAGCLDRCELGPTLVIYPEGVWYRAETRADIDEILTGHVRDGKPVERLMLGKDDK